MTARSIGEFFDAYEKYDRFQGGYVWDWVDQGLNCVDKATGETFWYAEFPL
jgi:beta-galactosidase